MPSRASISLFRNVLEDDDFRRLYLGEDGTLDRNPLDEGIADFRRAVIDDQQDIFERDGFADFDGQPIDFDRFTFTGNVLLAARFHDCIFHFSRSPASLHHHPCEHRSNDAE